LGPAATIDCGALDGTAGASGDARIAGGNKDGSNYDLFWFPALNPATPGERTLDG
jgi:hypothetical protein